MVDEVEAHVAANPTGADTAQERHGSPWAKGIWDDELVPDVHNVSVAPAEDLAVEAEGVEYRPSRRSLVVEALPLTVVDAGSQLDVGPSHRWSMMHEEEGLERGELDPDGYPTEAEEVLPHPELDKPGDVHPGVGEQYSGWACPSPVRFEAAASEL